MNDDKEKIPPPLGEPPKISAEEIEKEAEGVLFQTDKPLQRKENENNSNKPGAPIQEEFSLDTIKKDMASFAMDKFHTQPKENNFKAPQTHTNLDKLQTAKPVSVENNISRQNIGKNPPIVRTFQSDISDLIKKGGVSASKVAIAETKRRSKNEDGGKIEISDTEHKRSIIIGWVSIILLVGGLIFLSFIFLNSKEDKTKSEVFVAPSQIFVGSQKEIDTTDLDREEIILAIQKEISETDIRLNTIRQIYFTRRILDTKEILPPNIFFGTLTLDIPPIFLRLFSGDYMFGIHSFNGNTPFIIANVTGFDNAFSGMLKWEKTLVEDILPLFGEKTVSVELSQARFEDAVFKNQDVRVLRDSKGLPVILYAFISVNTLVITTDLSTLDEVIRRLLTFSR